MGFDTLIGLFEWSLIEAMISHDHVCFVHVG